MAYSTSKPPTQRHQDIGNQGPAEWGLDGSDTAAAVAASGFISNARDLGMKVGDILRYRQNVSPPVITTMSLAAITAAGASDFSDGTSLPVTNAG